MRMFEAEMLGLPRTGLPLLRDAIHERTGLSYDDRRLDMLGERLAPLVVERGLRSFLDLHYLLKFDPDAAPSMWRTVFDALSVQETYFWREIDQVRAVVCRVVPELARTHREPIRIWSAPCATGEEPLTIAMVLNEAGWFDRVPIEIFASDGSQAAIAKARTGQYRSRSFRALPPALKDKYFSGDEDVSTPDPSLSSRISSWSVVNLLSKEEVAPYLRCPIVFCRNAFIYFSQQSVRRVVDTYASGMPTPGFLCVGAAESLLSVTAAFALEEIEGAFVYVKR